MQTKYQVVIAGSTGLVGADLLNQLLHDKDVGKVISLVRRKSGNTHPKLQEEIIDFDGMQFHQDLIKGDAVFCCLGTTMKKAGSKENFKKVDYEYPLKLAQLAIENGVKQFHLISAMGANKNSGIFYNKVKGEIEDAIAHLKFNHYNIYRPSLLMGDRQEKRTGEKVGIVLAKFINPLLAGPLRKYRGIHIQDVATAMRREMKNGKTGEKIILSDEIYDIARN